MLDFTKLQEQINSNDGAIRGHLSLVKNTGFTKGYRSMQTFC